MVCTSNERNGRSAMDYTTVCESVSLLICPSFHCCPSVNHGWANNIMFTVKITMIIRLFGTNAWYLDSVTVTTSFDNCNCVSVTQKVEDGKKNLMQFLAC